MPFYLFVLHAGIIILLVFAPSMTWNILAGRRIDLALMPIPGILLLSLWGFISWWWPGGLSFNVISIFYAVLVIIILVGIFIFKFRPCATIEDKIVLSIVALIFVQAITVGINPLPVGQEYNSGGAQPGRMIASPPDHGIPFDTARYFFAGLDGKERSKEFFGELNVTSRGPLVPLGINALFNLFILKGGQESGGLNSIVGGPQHLASIYGWLLNSLVVFGVFQVCRAAEVKKTTLLVAISWVALAPVTIINVVYTWPKLLATYFILLAVSSIIFKRIFVAGIFMGLAWLSHPVGALALPALWLFVLLYPDGLQDKSYIARTEWLVGGCLIIMMPWIYYKWSLAAPDPFLKYVLGGGEGLKPAQTLTVWLETRWNNVIYTIIPFKFFFDGRMSTWLYGPLNNGLRWFVQYAKELPGQLGFSCFIVAYSALILFKKTSDSKAFLGTLIVFFITQIVFWGFSSDGLGRNSLEPLTVLLIVFSCIYYEKASDWVYLSLPVLAVEGQLLQIAGYVFAFEFVSDIDLTKGATFLVVSMLCSLSVLLIFYKNVSIGKLKNY